MPKHGQNKWMIGGIIIAATIVAMSVLSLDEHTVYFYTPDEAIAKSETLQEQNIKIGGMVTPHSVKWQAESLSLDFTISDLSGSLIKVHHKGTPPDMFKENQGVIVEGSLSKDGKSFIAHRLMVKHSEEYKVPEDKSINKALLEKSIFK